MGRQKKFKSWLLLVPRSTSGTQKCYSLLHCTGQPTTATSRLLSKLRTLSSQLHTTPMHLFACRQMRSFSLTSACIEGRVLIKLGARYACALVLVHNIFFSFDGQSRTSVAPTNQHGWTALHHAANWGYVDCVKKLLDLGADPYAQVHAFVRHRHPQHGISRCHGASRGQRPTPNLVT